MTAPLTIRPYQAADEARVLELWQAAGLIRPWNDPRRDIARKLAVQPAWFLVGLEDDALVATLMAGYEGHRGWLNYLAVDPACRRRGHALALLRHAEQALAAVGCPKISLQVRAGNAEAIAFYRRIGYLPDEVVCFGKRLIVDEAPAR